MKYIIELNPDCVDGEFLRIPIRLAGEDQWIKTKASLTPYTETDRKAIEDEMWEFVRICLVMDGSDFVDAFDSCSYINLLEYSYQEAKAKYEAWLKQKDKIRIGNEVRHTTGDGVRGVVIKIHDDDNTFDILDSDGDVYEYTSMKYWEKTGRHFNHVAELLKKMSEDT